jgi:gag-polyprotein putative aspartyl protease
MIIARGLFGHTLALSVVFVAGAATVASADQGSLWVYNDSVMYLLSNGQEREFRYQEPRQVLMPFGVTRGTLVFRGFSHDGEYVGTAFTFTRECGALSFSARGPILDNGKRILLAGRLPQVDAWCQNIGSVDHQLEFRLVKGIVDEVPPNRGAGRSPRSSPTPPATLVTVPLKREGNTLLVPVIINGAITLDFVVDSGAADVSITEDVFWTLTRTHTIQKSDLTGTKDYRLADGSTVSLPTFQIRSLTLAGTAIENVNGSVAPAKGDLLLGQSFLTRFKSWSIDNAKQTLVLELYGEQSSNPVLYAPVEPASPAPAAQDEYSVVKNLNMREFPDPRSANVLSRWAPEDFIAQGTTFTGQRFCENGPTGYIWCRVTYNHHNTQTTGWVAGYYLWSAKDRRRLACLYPSPDPDCSR